MGVRRSAATLSAAELTDLRDAFTALYGISDDRGYAFLAGVHGLPLPQYCKHGSILFLPWHRAYLYFMERAMIDALRRSRDDPAAVVGLPWWDWSSTAAHADGGGLPPGWLAPVDGGANALASGPMTLGDADLERVRANLPGAVTDGAGPVTVRDPDTPDQLPKATTVNRALSATSFTEFSQIVEGIHNGVHGWVGGAMSAVPIAAYDPIFWSHHAMIDRLWYLWQLSPRGADPSAALLDTALPPWPMTVRQTLSVPNLGYDYAAQVVG